MSKSFIHFLTLLFSPNEYIINLRANMFEKNISQEFKFKTTDETRNYFIEEINQYHLMIKKHKKKFHGFKLH